MGDLHHLVRCRRRVLRSACREPWLKRRPKSNSCPRVPTFYSAALMLPPRAARRVSCPMPGNGCACWSAAMLRPGRLERCLDFQLAGSRPREAPFGAASCWLCVGFYRDSVIAHYRDDLCRLIISPSGQAQNFTSPTRAIKAQHEFSRQPITVHDGVVFIRTWGSPYRKTICDEREH